LPAAPETIFANGNLARMTDRVEHSFPTSLWYVIVDYEIPDGGFFALHRQGGITWCYLISEL
jgi:hypothetical protein